ncbi:DMT family transporter [Alloacidobacterium dinghuense]|uniref:DMT family transporter n=1 Tax=Alloacidobacterium dinghuense TaxID=2763107 RepID=A0A7G8BH72_9BACT|nr:DMT family transporter [Alloacidobacterium dinghuense]QNI31892.1 DMT family transporter [Alloacidobacterium dinghuense]
MMTGGGEASALALLAAVVWGTSDFCGGIVTRRTTPAIVLMIAHGLGLLALLAALAIHPSGLPTRHTVVFGLIAGLAGGVGLLALYRGLSLGSMGLVAALSGVLAAAVPVLVSFFTEARPSLLKLAGFAVAGVAIWLIAYAPGTEAHPHGLGLGVLAGVCFGLLLLFLHIAGRDSALWALTFSRVGSVGCALALGIWTFLRRRPKVSGVRWAAIIPLAATAGLLDTSGNLLYTVSSLMGRLDVAAVLSSLYPAGTILLAVWLLRERATRSQSFGMALAIVAVVMISA